MSWDDLPSVLLAQIAALIAHHADYIRFRAVCKSWLAAVRRTPTHLPPQIPFVAAFPPPDRPILCFSVTERRVYHLQHPARSRRSHRLGSSHGWLILIGPGPAIRLHNPFTRSSSHLPPATEIPYMFDSVGPADIQKSLAGASSGGGNWWKFFITRAKLCWDRTHDGMWVAVAFPKVGVAFCRRGDETWSHAGRLWRFADVELFKGKLYALTQGGILSTIDITGAPVSGIGDRLGAKENVVTSSAPFLYGDTTAYLVQSVDDLLIVVRRYTGEEGDRWTSSFEVYQLIESADDPCWIRVDDLGDRIIVVERGTSVSLPSPGLPGCTGNCIYFTKESDGRSYGDKNTEHDLGVYSLKDCCVYGSCSAADGAEAMGLPPPILMTPVLW